MKIGSVMLMAMLICLPEAARAQTVSPESAETVSEDIPLPRRNPKRTEPPPPPHPRDIAAPEWTAQEIQAAVDRCDMLLSDIGVDYTPVDPIREGVCGTPAPIELRSIGKTQKISIDPPARITCNMAATLSAWADTVIQPAARHHLGSEIVSIRNVASYVCRNRYNAPGKRISEHAHANALDMAGFTTADGKTVSVLKDWALPPDKAEGQVKPTPDSAPNGPAAATSPATDVQHTHGPESPAGTTRGKPSEKAGETSDNPVEPPAYRPESAFLYAIHEGACKLFGTVLGPLSNEAHKNHFHYDLAPRRHSNYCE